MHFYSKVGITGTFDGSTSPLESGFTESHATRGDIPVPATEDDPSTIFYLDGGKDPSDPADGVNPRVFISTQGLYVKGNATDPDHGDAGHQGREMVLQKDRRKQCDQVRIRSEGY